MTRHYFIIPIKLLINKLISVNKFLEKMKTKDLLKEAIADAKAVRETALAQAKLALEEAFAPRLQSMLAAKLHEMEDEDLDESKDMEEEAMYGMEEEAAHSMAHDKMEETADMDADDTIDEIDLDEILAELNAEMENEAAGLNEAEEAEEEEEEAEEDMEDVEADAEESEEEEKEVSELSMDELEDLIRDIVSQEVGGDGMTDDEANADDMADMGDMDIEAGAEEDEFNLDEILAELLSEESEELDERKKYGGNKGDVPAAKRGDKKDTAEEEGVEDYKKKKKMEEDLQLALEAVNTLRQELQEVNLLNAKLLYVNKIFKAKNLNESQKLKVVKAFDKAESAKEAKLVYESLSDTFAAVPAKQQIKESLGFASKAAGVAPQKQVIVESNDFVARMQKLANIK
jgi:hypothetical protein